MDECALWGRRVKGAAHSLEECENFLARAQEGREFKRELELREALPWWVRWAARCLKPSLVVREGMVLVAQSRKFLESTISRRDLACK